MGKSQNRLLPDRAKRQKTITPVPSIFERSMEHNGQFAMSSPITGGKIRLRGEYVNGFFKLSFEGKKPEKFHDFAYKLLV